MPNAFETTFNTRVIPAANRGFGVSVTLSRGALTTAEFTARRNDKHHTSMGAKYGLDISVVMRDFILPVESIVIDGIAVEPKRLDIVREVETAEAFEVLQPDDNTPAVELLPGGYEWLVHTKKIKLDV
jgi:hypothetical protein